MILTDEFEIIYDLNIKSVGYTKIDNVKNVFVADIKCSSSRSFENMPWLIKLN